MGTVKKPQELCECSGDLLGLYPWRGCQVSCAVVSAFFAIYVNDIIKLIQQSNFGCKIGIVNVSIFLYADDIILLAPSVDALQRMLILCENHLQQLDMALNSQKICLS